MHTVYEKLCVDLPKTAKDELSSLTFRAFNDTPHSNTQICPTTIVFGIYPKIKEAVDRGSLMERTEITRKCTAIVAHMKAKRTANETANVRNNLSHKEIGKVRTFPQVIR